MFCMFTMKTDLSNPKMKQWQDTECEMYTETLSVTSSHSWTKTLGEAAVNHELKHVVIVESTDYEKVGHTNNLA